MIGGGATASIRSEAESVLFGMPPNDHITPIITSYTADYAPFRPYLDATESAVVRARASFLLFDHYPHDLGSYIANLAATNDTHQIDMAVIMLVSLQLFMAVAHMRSNGVVHRDIKSDNVFITDGNIVKVGDFACALQLCDAHQNPKSYTDATQLSSGASIASPPEIRNELKSRENLDRPLTLRPSLLAMYDTADVWSVGAMIYQLLGNSFFHKEAHVNLLALTSRVPCYYGDDEVPRVHGTDVPVSFSSLLARCISCDPTKRPQASEGVTLIQLMLWGPSDLEISMMASLEACTEWLQRARLATQLLLQARPGRGSVMVAPPTAGSSGHSGSISGPVEELKVSMDRRVTATGEIGRLVAIHPLRIAFILRTPALLWQDVQLYQRLVPVI
jgi:serine/threonine protein kinase